VPASELCVALQCGGSDGYSGISANTALGAASDLVVAQGGTGSKTSGPSVRKIYEALFGVSGSTVDASRSVLVGGKPREALPVFRPDGTPVGPPGKEAGVVPQRGETVSAMGSG
jgi:hypothetical protein